MSTRGTPAPYFKSLNRPILILGIDRSLFFLLIGLCLPIAFSGHLSWVMDMVAAIIFFICYLISLLITRVDAQILILYRRHIHYQLYYSAQPSLFSKKIIPRVSVPLYSSKGGLI